MPPVNPFTEGELELAASVQTTYEILIHAQRIGTAALSDFGDKDMLPLFEGQLHLTDYELAVGMTFYRLLGLLRTLRDLHRTYQFQVIAAASRSAFEMCVDIALLVDGNVENAVEKFHGFTRAARFSSAFKLVSFYDKHPGLEDEGDAEEQRILIETPGKQQEIEAICQSLWKRNKAPEHWSGLRWSQQVELAGQPFEECYVRWASLLAWQVHGGGAGVGGLSADSIRAVEVVCRELVKAVVPIAFKSVGVAMHMHRALPLFFEKLEFVTTTVETYASIDARLRTLGHPSKFGV